MTPFSELAVGPSRMPSRAGRGYPLRRVSTQSMTDQFRWLIVARQGYGGAEIGVSRSGGWREGDAAANEANADGRRQRVSLHGPARPCRL